MSYLVPVFCFLAAFLTIETISWLELLPWRKSVAEHWTERSRILFPVSKTHSILVLYVPLLLAAGSSLVWSADLLNLVPRWLAASAGATGAGWFVVRQLFPGTCLRPWLRDVVVGWVLQHGRWIVLFGVGVSMPDDFGNRTCLTIAGVMIVQFAWPFVVLRLLRLPGILKPPGERLRKIVASCTKDGGPQVRGLWQLSGVHANAFAMPSSNELIFCDRLLDLLTDDEVAAVCSHELGHLAESKRVRAGKYFGAMASTPLLLLKPAAAQWESLGIIGMLLLMIFWSRWSRKLRLRMELRADAVATHQAGGEGVYAGALQKIYQHNLSPAVMPGNQATHPHLYDRMVAAGTTPEFPRPQAPRKFTLSGWFMLFAGPFFLMWIYFDGIQTRQAGDRKTTRQRHVHRPSAIPPAGR